LYKGKKIFGLVTARAGSKRLKNKNTLKLHKKPLFYWTINEAKKSEYLDNLYISTDDKKIKFFIKKQSKINLINRAKKLSQDGTKSEDVVSDFIKKVKSGYDIICLLQPTSPYRRYFDIDNAIKKMVNNNSKTLISITESKNKNYKFNGAIYLVDAIFFKKNKTFHNKKTIFYKMPKSRSLDIDTKEDFKIAKKIKLLK
jgi:CMP-N-acetylneuraminic acid synthetase